MHCLVCRTPLMLARRHGVEVESCPRCRGMWLDGGELARIVERATALALARASLGDHGEPVWDDTPPPAPSIVTPVTPATRAADQEYTNMFT